MSGRKKGNNNIPTKYRERYHQQTLTQMPRIFPPSWQSQIAEAEAAGYEDEVESVGSRPEDTASSALARVTPARTTARSPASTEPPQKKKKGGYNLEVPEQHPPTSEEQALLNFNFDHFIEGEDVEVVINWSGDHVTVQAPRLTISQQPKNGFLSYHVYMSCSRPERNIFDRTVIPLSGCCSYYFYDKRYIAHENSRLNGKINVWRIESMKSLTKARLNGKLESAIEKQMTFARDRVGDLMQRIADFDHCVISILSLDGINRTLLGGGKCTQMATFVYHMCKWSNFKLIILPGETINMIDIVTRFAHDKELDFVFGKNDEEKMGDFVKMTKTLITLMKI